MNFKRQPEVVEDRALRIAIAVTEQFRLYEFGLPLPSFKVFRALLTAAVYKKAIDVLKETNE